MVSVVLAIGLFIVNVFLKVNASFALGLSTKADSQIQFALGIDAVHAELYGVATRTAGVPLAIDVVLIHGTL